MKNMLLLSGSSYKSTGYLVHCKEWVREFFSNINGEILFIPYAGVTRSNDEYEKKVQDCLEFLNIVSIHRKNNPKEAIKEAKAIIVGGGNTFKLVHDLYEKDLMQDLRDAVNNGAYYFGWSAGANLAGINMKTTNDMPIIMPKSFDTLGLISYNINPHFISGKIPGHNGESREQRLAECMVLNNDLEILALPEGSGLRIFGNVAKVIGNGAIYKMRYGNPVCEISLNQTLKA